MNTKNKNKNKNKNPGRLNSNDLVWFGFIYQQKIIISCFIILGLSHPKGM